MSATSLAPARGVDPGPRYWETCRSPDHDDQGRRLGRAEPRICTPPLRELTPATSLGFAVIDFADQVLRVRLHPWQKVFLIRALELLPDNTLRFRTVVLLVARQNGKSLISQVLALWFMYVYGLPLVLGTAQDLDTAEEVWQGAVDLVTELDDDDQPIRPELLELVNKITEGNGKKSLIVNRPEHGSGKAIRRYRAKASSRKAGRGLSGDLVLLDELREHQTWDAWAAITKTTMARALALVLCLSNAGDAASIVLRYLRKLAHDALGDPDGINGEDGDELQELLAQAEGLDDEAEELLEDGDTLAIFEWSTPLELAVTDRDGWAMANPSMNHPNGIAERTIASACRTDPEFVFRPEVLCQWLDTARGGPFPDGTWEAGRWAPSRSGETPPKIVGQVKACIDVSHDRTMTYIAFAGRRESGLPQVELVAQRAGTSWVKEWLNDPKRRDRIDAVTGQAKGAPVSGLLKELKAAVEDAEDDFDLSVVDWAGDDLAGWTGDFYDLVKAGAVTDEGEQVGLRHMPQPRLDVAAATTVFKPLGDRFVADRKASPTDAAPLVAAIGAVGLLLHPETDATSSYEDYDLLVL